MNYDLEDNQEDYRSLSNEYWCEIVSNIQVKDNRKRVETQIKRLETSHAAPNSDRDESIRVLCKKRVRTGVPPNRKQQGGNPSKNHEDQHYCMLCKKSVIHEQNYMSHSSENCFGKSSDQKYIKEGLEGALGNRDDAFKRYNKSEKQWNKQL